MSKYTTGEVAKLCDVSVRTVQYYDQRGIVTPDELTEGGRRLYSEDGLRRMKLVCFLRETGLPINVIAELLKESQSSKSIDLLIEQQKRTLKSEIDERGKQLAMLTDLQRGLRTLPTVSVDSIGDIAAIMKQKSKLNRMRRMMVLTGLPVSVLQWVSIILWITNGLWWLFVLWAVVAVIYGVVTSKYYYDHVKYVCPECHTPFKPTFKEMFFAPHTPTLRKLTCPHCHVKSYCVEVYDDGKDEKK